MDIIPKRKKSKNKKRKVKSPKRTQKRLSRKKSTRKTYSKQEERTPPSYEGEEIILNEHQLNSIYKIVESRKDQHGLLFWWMMGTGKTIGGLSFILNYPGKDVNIICPKDITFVWQNELKKFPKITNKITFLNYENPDAIFQKSSYENELIIMDEAQHIIPIIKATKSIKQTIDLMNTSFKTIILTGTPIYNDLSDLAYLVNMAAGKIILPYNVTEFNDKFYKINKQRSIFIGHLIPILSTITKFKDIIFNLITPITGLYALSNPGEAIKTIVEFNPVSMMLGKPNIDVKTGEGGKIIIDEGSKNRNLGNLFKTLYLLFFLSIVLDILKALLNYSIGDYKFLNAKILANTINPYVSYYKNKEAAVSDFPKVERETIIVSYSSYQLGKWIEITQGAFDIKTIADLNIQTEEEATFYTKKLSMDEYKTKGVIIGNLKNDLGEYSPKFERILEKAKGKRAVFYSSFVNNGIELFKEFLTSKGIKYIYLGIGISTEQKNQVLEEFKTTTTFLLLHPSYTEGVSILGAEQIHLLEPIPLLAKKEQVIARVVRYKSHAHLPQDQRHVEVFQWACEMNSITSRMHKLMVSIKKWLKFKSEVFYTDNYKTFSQDMTPDSLILRDEYVNIVNDRNITKILEKSSTNEKITCCIKFPSNSQEESCMINYQKHCD